VSNSRAGEMFLSALQNSSVLKTPVEFGSSLVPLHKRLLFQIFRPNRPEAAILAKLWNVAGTD
jgi:hypothetical protein